MSFSRRSFLGSAAALSLSGLASAKAPKPKQRAKNVILLVSDGMPVQIAGAWDYFSRQVNGKRSAWSQLMRRSDAVQALHATRSLNALVTDSAAAGSAWGSGRRIYNGAINEYPDGTKLKSIAQLAKEQGLRVGMVTTSRITHATPASFAVQCPNRDLEDQIADLYLENEIDVLMGGGSRNFDPAGRADKKDLFAEFRRGGWQVARSRSEALAASGRMIGLFTASHLPYSIDRDNSEELQRQTPTLAEMTRKAISLLSGGKGFLLQVEAARVDHAGHGNDLGGMLFDQRDFELALEAALEFADNDGETLVIVTSDHGCGGPSFNGMGDGYTDSNTALDGWLAMKASHEALLPRLQKASSSADIQEIVRAAFGFGLKPAEAEIIAAAIKGQASIKESAFYSNSVSAIGIVMSNYHGVGWTSTQHTAEHTLLSAIGPGAHRLHGQVENTDLFDAMCAALDIRHRNPLLSPAEARRAAELRGWTPHETFA